MASLWPSYFTGRADGGGKNTTVVLRALSVTNHLYGDQIVGTTKRYVELPGDPERVANHPHRVRHLRRLGQAYFANIMRQIGQPFKVLYRGQLTQSLDPRARREPDVGSLNRHPPTRRLPNKFNASKTNTLARSSPSCDSTTDERVAEMKLLIAATRR